MVSGKAVNETAMNKNVKCYQSQHHNNETTNHLHSCEHHNESMLM